MESFSEMLMSFPFITEGKIAENLYGKNTWIPWISAILGTFIVGVSGLVPLILFPDTNSSTTSQSSQYRETINVSTKSHNIDGQAVLIRRYSRQQLQSEVVKKEQTLKRYLSFAVGSLLGDICLHLLPEIYRLKVVDSTIEYSSEQQLRLGIAILVGILSFLAIEKIFEFTQVRYKNNCTIGEM